MNDFSTVDETKTIRESKFYELCRSTQLFDHLVPHFVAQMAVEDEIRTTNPRDEGNDTPRVFVHYTNAKGNSLLFKVDNPIGLNSPFDIDDFLAGYSIPIQSDLDAIGGGDIVSMQFVTMTALSYALGVVLKFEKDTTNGRLTKTCKQVVDSIISCLYDDSLDTMILCRDGKPREDGERQITITQMWSMTKH